VAYVDPQKCVGCLTCTRTCPFGIPQVFQPYDQTEIDLQAEVVAGRYSMVPARHRVVRTGVGGLGGAAYIDPAQCQGCGTCTGECPANAIQLINYTDQQMMLRAIGGLGEWRDELYLEVKA
jgi:heterodisulfide reductase subunit A-like polyferredoxin